MQYVFFEKNCIVFNNTVLWIEFGILNCTYRSKLQPPLNSQGHNYGSI